MRYILGKIEDVICAICLIIMTSLTFANVIARYVFSASFSFSEEITTSARRQRRVARRIWVSRRYLTCSPPDSSAPSKQ